MNHSVKWRRFQFIIITLLIIMTFTLLAATISLRAAGPTPTPCTAPTQQLAPTFIPSIKKGIRQNVPLTPTSTESESVACATSVQLASATLIGSPGARLQIVKDGTPTPSLTASATLTPTPTKSVASISPYDVTLAPTFIPSRKVQTIGVYRPSNSTFLLRYSNTTGYADDTVTFGIPGDVPVTGDWDGDGFDSVGIFRSRAFYLSNSIFAPANLDYNFSFGVSTDVPLAGRWLNSGGPDGVGVYRPSTGQFFLKNALTTGYGDYSLSFGSAWQSGDTGLTWDCNGLYQTCLGLYRPSNNEGGA